MKNHFRKIRYCIFCLAAIMAIFLSACMDWPIYAAPTIVYTTTSMSESWPTFKSDEFGIHIKYPPSKPGFAVNISQTANSVNFMFLQTNIEITQFDGSLDSRIKSWGGTREGEIQINGMTALRMRTLVPRLWGDGDFYYTPTRNEFEEHLYIKDGPLNYEITWQPNWDENPDAKSRLATCIEMISTFGVNAVAHSDFQSNTDPDLPISFTYPTEWQFSWGGFPNAILTSRNGDDRITFFSYKISAADWIRKQGPRLTYLEDKQELFSQKITGQKCILGGRETYIFERGENLYVISVDRVKGSRQEVDDILNSLKL